MEELSGIQVELETPVTEDTFEKFFRSRLQLAVRSLKSRGELVPVVMILKDGKLFLFNIPEGFEETSDFFTALSEAFKGTDGYIFLSETWSLTMQFNNLTQLQHMTDNPEEIALNPFKDEHLAFEAHGFGQEYIGYIGFDRDDVGNIVLGDTIMSNDEERVVSITERLLPMLN